MLSGTRVRALCGRLRAPATGINAIWDKGWAYITVEKMLSAAEPLGELPGACDSASIMRVLMGVYLPSDEIRIVLSAARLDRIIASAPRFCSEDGTLSSLS